MTTRLTTTTHSTETLAGASSLPADPRLRVALAVALAVGWGVLAGVWTPRGPLTAVEVVGTLVASAVVGWGAGALLRSRWAMVAPPVAFVAAFEVVRLGAVGPTVDAIRPGGIYAILAFAAGRGLHGLMAIVPMVVGAAIGAGVLRRFAAVAGAVAVLAMGTVAALPGSTAPITGSDGEPLPGSVAELTRARVGDHDLAMMVRGTDVTNPVLLFLAGGPGGTELGAMRRHLEVLEDDFVVVTLDQRGTGRSYDQIEPTRTLTLESAVADVIGVTEHLRDRFETGLVFLVGQSWGTIPGVLAVRERPDLYAAYVGVGQMVSPRETDRIFYADTLAWAREGGDADLVASLERIGAPPYEDLLHYPQVLSYEQQVYPYDHSANSEGAGQMMENLPVPEYGVLGTVHVVAGLLDTFAVLYPQIQDVDLRADAPRLEVPVYLVQGRYEARGRTEPARAWFAVLDAPAKAWIEAETSGHRPLFEQPGLFHAVMAEVSAAAGAP